MSGFPHGEISGIHLRKRSRNADRVNQNHRDYVGDQQQQFHNRTTATAGATGQYTGGADAATREVEAQREEERRRAQQNAGMGQAIIGAITGKGEE